MMASTSAISVSNANSFNTPSMKGSETIIASLYAHKSEAVVRSISPSTSVQSVAKKIVTVIFLDCRTQLSIIPILNAMAPQV
jgi:hypothetical protein